MILPDNKAFCDTSFFFASLCPHDTNFEKAGEFLEYCRDNAVTLYTTWDIISETVTLLRYRMSHKAAVEFLDTVKSALYINELPRRKQRGIKIFHKRSKRPKGRGISPGEKIKYDDSIRDAAEKVFKRLSRDKRFSFCDAISYVVITSLLKGIPCFTFDRDFKNLGLLVYP